ncbi:hypothetical protein [Streptomyces roseolilacinus]|uniref:Secreted protein n=1 Tax=Streptomyces roseolilacinus TaxID=66904 RepID=A0A918AZR3_9ACTN|nr:hypothetical protein [Streptomyces roseolilacinus]GGP96843.1 hypothetical protein GCM10010249_13950 [Streptomyces roseolilacinus]
MTVLRLTLKAAWCSVVALLMTVVWTQPANAWTWATRVTVYNGSGLCVQGDAGIDHLRPATLSGNIAYANTYALTPGCGTGLSRPDGWAAARATVYRWNGSAWAVCRTSPWKYGATGQSGGEFPGPWGPKQVYDWGGWQACGQGYYGTIASAFVWDGSAWRGGDVWSGHEFASSARFQGSRPPAPEVTPQRHATPPPLHPLKRTGAR